MVIRSWAKSMRGEGKRDGERKGDKRGREGEMSLDDGDVDGLDNSYIEIVRQLKKSRGHGIRSRLFGYLHFQMGKNRLTVNAKSALDHAMDAIDDITDHGDRIEELRYLSTATTDLGEFTVIRDRIAAIRPLR